MESTMDTRLKLKRSFNQDTSLWEPSLLPQYLEQDRYVNYSGYEQGEDEAERGWLQCSNEGLPIKMDPFKIEDSDCLIEEEDYEFMPLAGSDFTKMNVGIPLHFEDRYSDFPIESMDQSYNTHVTTNQNSLPQVNHVMVQGGVHQNPNSRMPNSPHQQSPHQNAHQQSPHQQSPHHQSHQSAHQHSSHPHSPASPRIPQMMLQNSGSMHDPYIFSQPNDLVFVTQKNPPMMVQILDQNVSSTIIPQNGFRQSASNNRNMMHSNMDNSYNGSSPMSQRIVHDMPKRTGNKRTAQALNGGSGKIQLKNEQEDNDDEEDSENENEVQRLPSGPIGALIQELTNTIQKTQENLELVRNEIRSTPLPLNREKGTFLLQILNKVQNTLDEEIQKSTAIESQTLLHCRYQQMIRTRITDLRRQNIQAELYRKEIEHCFVSPDYGDTLLATLFIVSQPFPTVLKQHMKVDPVEILLLKGARTEISVLGPVKALLINDWSLSSTKKSVSPMECNEEHLHQDIVTFDKLQFNVGTGVKAVQMKFRVKVRVILGKSNYNQAICGEERIIESNPSEPFIVMTNTKQWAEAQGILLKKCLFNERRDIIPKLFCNLLQHHFMQACKQDPLKCFRPLSPNDSEFFFKSKLPRACQGSAISQKEYDEFWAWFGPILQKIRYYKFLLAMWNAGLFWGFVSKAESEEVLKNLGTGSFLLRFSERMIGAMAVAYKQSEGQVRHYLIKSKDIQGQGRSIPQFIRDTTSLLQFVKITITEDLQRRITLIDKEEALQKIACKRTKTSENKGDDGDYYDDQILELGLNSLRIHDD